MRIVVFNVRFSPNLGDGILAECLERQLGTALPGAQVETVDLAGRTAYGGQARRRSGALRLLSAMPPPVRRAMVERVLGRRLAALRTVWRERIANADAVIIGGGNLFQDDDLNFPLKIGQVLELCREEKCPVGIYAVGVGSQWSPRAATLFEKLRACDVFHVSVRDEGALQNWKGHFGAGPAAVLAPDPALTLEQVTVGRKPRTRPLVGLCVTHPLVLRRHASVAAEHILLGSDQEYRTLAAWLLQAGCDVLFFTNGALEDQSSLERIRALFSRTGGTDPQRCDFAKRPASPEELVSLLGRFDAVVAHRLHACITAYALGVPPIGLGWDQKVEAFFDLIDREPFFISAHKGSVTSIGERILTTLNEGVDPGKQRRCVQNARMAVAGLANDLESLRHSRVCEPA
ncbi:polysaccharide pyruvyl transferase family protein [uncultured Nitratireductor sp.]|uniref:polysaccharide pyruvyl transferase family protein n=1 Tax=uncultured Nitratireductor sp. TaxID=520953 RepID=UPI0025E1741C|nr:polysaccharide pyruvyl transferase family protein [uncultured Nitratireductor sp.]